MNINPYTRLIEYTNDESDFRMPYLLHGKLDKDVMLDKYMRLTNKPTSYLEIRFIQYQW
jgi:hypothetical protein